MAKFAKILEAFSIKDSLNKLSNKVRDHVSNMVQDASHSTEKVSLLSEIDVTHACIVNGNYGFYPDDKLKKSTDSWTKPFKKPVLVHHDQHKDPVGRNVGSVYHSISPAVMPQVQNSIRDTDFTYRGLGYIRNLVNTTDPDAVAKVLDGRYLTVSVGGETDSMVCSICQRDWLEDGRCEHRFGNSYKDYDTEEDKLAFWTSGNMLWDELSYVNNPADVFAVVATRELAGDAKDQVLQVYNYKDVTVSDSQKLSDEKYDRLFSLYAFNDSTKKMAKLSDSTSLDALYKVYGQRILGIGADLNDHKEPVVTEPVKPVVKDETPIAAAIVAPVVTETPVVEAVVVTPATDAVVAVAPVVVEPAPIVAPITKDEKPVIDPLTALKDEMKKLEDEIKTSKETISKLTQELKDAKTEKEEAIKQSTSLNGEIRNMRINRLLDIRQELGLAAFATEDARKAEFDAYTAQSIQSIEDQLKTAETDAKKNAKRLPEMGNQNGSEPLADELNPLQKQLKAIDNMRDEEVAALLLSGRYNPPVMK